MKISSSIGVAEGGASEKGGCISCISGIINCTSAYRLRLLIGVMSFLLLYFRLSAYTLCPYGNKTTRL